MGCEACHFGSLDLVPEVSLDFFIVGAKIETGAYDVYRAVQGASGGRVVDYAVSNGLSDLVGTVFCELDKREGR